MKPRRQDSPAPLFVDTLQWVTWIHGRLERGATPLASSLCMKSLALLDAITLSLKGRERDLRVVEADELLISLRVQVRLAMELRSLTEDQGLFALEGLDGLGRQLGGWIRRLHES